MVRPRAGIAGDDASADDRHGERGSVSAEFAVAVPAILLLLIACVSVIQTSSLTLRASDAAADAARIIARGDPADVASERVGDAVDGARLSWSDDGSAVCATVAVALPVAFPFGGAVVESRSCALSGGG